MTQIILLHIIIAFALEVIFYWFSKPKCRNRTVLEKA